MSQRMTWILLALLGYLLAGAMLIAHTMRGMRVSAGADEWVVLILLWPLMLRFFLHLAVLQASLQHLQDWADKGAGSADPRRRSRIV